MHCGLSPASVADYMHGSTLALNLSLRRSAPYIWSAAIICVAALVRVGLGTFLGEHYPLGTFYAAVAIIGWFWGVSPAVLAAALGYLVGDYFFLTPRAPPFGTQSSVLEPVVYAAICSALIALVYRVYDRQRRLDQALNDHASARQALLESEARFKRHLDAHEKRAAEALELSERRYHAAAHARDQARQRLEVVTNAMSIGVAQCNRQMEYVWVNTAYARLIGCSPAHIEQFQGRRVEDVLGGAAFERLEPSFLRVLNGESAEFEGQLESGIDPNRWIHARYTPVWNGDPAPIGWVAVINDLTERRALEEQLRDTSRRKDAFLATLAHELRNPLAPIRYATQLLKPGTPTEMAADARRMIERQLGHMARLLDDLLDVSRITRGTLEIRRDTLDLRATLRHAIDAARPLAEAVEHDIRVELPNDPLPVSGDETRLIQVVGNIIDNAIKFTNPGGTIYVSAATDGAMIVATVRDTGRGISAEMLPSIFDMFVQGEPNSQAQSGLGIGLALAKQMIELHGGRIDAYSDGPRRGTEFRVLLPRVAEHPAMQDSLVDATKVSVLGANNIRVLIVDDNVDAADSLALFLKITGYQTRVAYDGRTAVEMAEILKPAVVLLDLGLPYLSGHEVARRLRALPWGRTARLIALTGWGQEEDVRRSRQSGFDEHLTKPVDPEVLIQHIIRLTRDQAQTGN
jgi:signal transduction histidine kinase/ActR/RegA family two-component response regulator